MASDQVSQILSCIYGQALLNPGAMFLQSPSLESLRTCRIRRVQKTCKSSLPPITNLQVTNLMEMSPS